MQLRADSRGPARGLASSLRSTRHALPIAPKHFVGREWFDGAGQGRDAVRDDAGGTFVRVNGRRSFERPDLLVLQRPYRKDKGGSIAVIASSWARWFGAMSRRAPVWS